MYGRACGCQGQPEGLCSGAQRSLDAGKHALPYAGGAGGKPATHQVSPSHCALGSARPPLCGDPRAFLPGRWSIHFATITRKISRIYPTNARSVSGLLASGGVHCVGMQGAHACWHPPRGPETGSTPAPVRDESSLASVATQADATVRTRRRAGVSRWSRVLQERGGVRSQRCGAAAPQGLDRADQQRL